MKTVLVVAGLDQELFDRLAAKSSKQLVPEGKLLFKPSPIGHYTKAHAQAYLDDAERFVGGLSERERVEFLVIAVDRGESTVEFCKGFFPFALVRTVAPPPRERGVSRSEYNRRMNEFLADLRTHALTLRRTAGAVRALTTLHNTTPLLLPLTNFRSLAYTRLMEQLFLAVGNNNHPSDLLERAVRDFAAAHPRTRLGDSRKSAFSDGELVFNSPGKARHAFFRNSKSGKHPAICALNARTRLGGAYDPTFHYDCMPIRGGLRARYPNCHAAETAPAGENHVNIAPNDFIR